jgi:hypothetical protein
LYATALVAPGRCPRSCITFAVQRNALPLVPTMTDPSNDAEYAAAVENGK